MNFWRKRLTDWLELMNYEAVNRTAPATPGLLKTMEGSRGLWDMSYKRPEEPLKFTKAKPRWILKAPLDVYKNIIRGIYTAAEAIAEAAVEMPRMLFSKWQPEVHQASEAPLRMLDGLKVVIGSYLKILCCPPIDFFVRTTNSQKRKKILNQFFCKK